MRNFNNLNALKVLVKRYETITIKEIKAKCAQLEENNGWIPIMFQLAEQLTGFGSVNSCTLCQNVSSDGGGFESPYCSGCVYTAIAVSGQSTPCLKFDRPSYDAIQYAECEDDLLVAYRNRASAIREAFSAIDESLS